jgi:hypothetical protein
MNYRCVIALITFGFLLGCNTPQQTGPSFGTVSPGASSVSQGQVVADAKKICGYVADAGPVVQIISSGTPGLSTADAIATAICKAVAAQTVPVAGAQAAPAPPPTVAGVVVTGKCLPSGCRASL